MGILSLSCWDFPSPSHGFSAHCRKSTLEEKNPPVRHATLSADNLVCDTRETTSSQGTQEAQVIPEGSEILLPKSSRNSSQSVSALLSDLQRSAQGIFSHLSVKCSITANASQVLSSYFCSLSAAFWLARRVTSILSGAEQHTCKPCGLFRNRDAAPSSLRCQGEWFQNIFTGNCKEKIDV